VHGLFPVPVPHVTFAGKVAVGSGPIKTRPRVDEDEVPRSVVDPTTTESSTLKFAFLIVNFAAAVATVIVEPLSTAIFPAGTAVVPDSDKLLALVIPAESGIGTPIVNGRSAPVTPVTPLGISC
jgi:hypothetical protein